MTTTRADTAGLIRMLVAAYPHAKIEKNTVAVYVEMLMDLPLDMLKAAILDHMADNKYFPAISELRDRVKQMQPNILPNSAEAWELVTREIRRIGYYGIPQFESNLLTRTVKAIGWREICASENTDVIRSNFLKIYEQLRTQEDRKIHLHPSVKKLLEGGQDAAAIGVDKQGVARLFPVHEQRPGGLPEQPGN